MKFDAKDEARGWVWETLQERKLAAFPFPPTGRIPNFKGASDAAARLFEHPLARGARAIKVNPDAPQRYVRHRALELGITVYVPTPRLRAGFTRLDPARIDPADRWKASSASRMKEYGEEVALHELPAMDLVVVGSVAVTLAGERCGKGHGYADLEYAILSELGHPAAPVATTVHAIQLVEGFPTAEHDLSLSLIVTPEATHETGELPGPTRVDWTQLDEAALDAMPVLRELRELADSGERSD